MTDNVIADCVRDTEEFIQVIQKWNDSLRSGSCKGNDRLMVDTSATEIHPFVF